VSLPKTQRWFAEIVMRPLTSENHMRIVGEDGRELAEIDSVIAPNSKLSAFERLEVYNRQYWFRLFEALDTDFPALIKLVGKERFRELAEAYISDCPSQSYTLRDLGSRLANWLVANPEKAGEQPEAAADVAKLEWAYVEAFDAAELPPAKAEEIAAAGEDAKLRLQPHIRFVELQTAVDEFTAKAHDNEFGRREKQNRRFGKDRFKPGETFTVAVYRKDDQVAQLPLENEAVVLVKAIADGKPLGDALESAFLNGTIPAEQIAPKIQQWFAVWSGLQWFTVAAE
jgi:Putative DNA-binding domain